jgi:endonuclease-3 related protein
MKMTPNKLYQQLFDDFGNLNWWPMDKEYHRVNKNDPRFEIIVGAILTQNTTWSNVEKAIKNLKLKKMLDIKNISNIHSDELQKLIRPSGFFNQKATRLKKIANFFVKNYSGNLDDFFNSNMNKIRKELLSINGIGPETADSILLYAGNLPIFVVDAYTKRICERLPLNTNSSYYDIQNYFESDLSKKFLKKELTEIYNQLHAMIVTLAKKYCKKNPDCTDCPLKKNCNFVNKLSK